MKIKIGDYLIKRLHELNVDCVYGVPGDYNLGFLDLIEDSKDVKWVGNCNELNAAYAADGYARIKGMGAIVTTFGVGELSAINGVAGSFTENVPVIKIVGSPSANVQNTRSLVHHSTGEGDFSTFSRMFKEITVAQTFINEFNAASEIDRVLTTAYQFKRPGYIELPVDIVSSEIDVDMKPLNLELKSNEETLSKFIKTVEKLISNSKNQMILADYKVLRTKTQAEVENLINSAKIPVSTLSMGKTSICEENPYFAGVYTGELSSNQLKNIIKSTDLAILIGVKLTDSTTAGFSYINEDMIHIEIDIASARIGKEVFTGIYIKDVINALANSGIHYFNENNVVKEPSKKFIPTDADITQNRYFEQLQDFFKEGDVVVAEQGTSYFGASTVNMPKGSTFIGQPLWGSIGYTVPAVLGTQMAHISRRNILLVGDGSFQLTAQEVSTMIRQNLNIVLFVVNNDGYTVERVIHGPRREYNDVQMWKYHMLPEVFSANNENKPLVFNVKTEQELANAMNKINENPNKLSFVEVHMGIDDVPTLLGNLAKIFVDQNGY